MSNIKYKRRLLCAITVFFWFAQYIYIPFLTPYLLSLSITTTVAGIIIGAYGIMQLTLRIPIGIILDIIKKHKLFIIIGSFLAGISSIGMLFFPSPVMLFISNAISGMASSVWVSFVVLFPVYYENNQTVRAIGIINAFQKFGVLIAFVIGGIAFGLFGIRSLFIVSFFAGLIGCILSFFIEPEPVVQKTNFSIAKLLSVVSNKRLLIFSFLDSFILLVIFGTVYSFSTSTANQLGATGMQLAVFTIMFTIGSVVGSYFTSTKVYRNWREKNIISSGFLILAVYCIWISIMPGLSLFFFIQLTCGFGYGMLSASLMAYAVKYVGDDKKATAMGFYQSVYCIGMIFGPVFMGILIDHMSRFMSFFIMALIALVCALFAQVIYRLNLFIPGKDR